MPISQIVTNSIADSAVVTVDIANGAVTSAKLATGAVNLASSTVTGQLPLATGVSGTLPRASLPSGSILQVQETTSTTPVTTSTATYVNLFSLSITPSSASSRILLMLGVPVYTQANAIPEMDVMRNGVTIVTFGFWQHINTGAYILSYPFNTHLDSPGTTSSITYTVRGRIRGGACTWVYQDGNGTMVGKITALEVAG